jgi:hypothetical protein
MFIDNFKKDQDKFETYKKHTKKINRKIGSSLVNAV